MLCLPPLATRLADLGGPEPVASPLVKRRTALLAPGFTTGPGRGLKTLAPTNGGLRRRCAAVGRLSLIHI